MKLADTNVWLALVISKHVFQAAAQDWLATETLDRNIVFCRSTQQSFLRLITTAGMLKPYGVLPFNNREAWELYERLLAESRISIVNEPAGLETRHDRSSFQPVYGTRSSCAIGESKSANTRFRIANRVLSVQCPTLLR